MSKCTALDLEVGHQGRIYWSWPRRPNTIGCKSPIFGKDVVSRVGSALMAWMLSRWKHIWHQRASFRATWAQRSKLPSTDPRAVVVDVCGLCCNIACCTSRCRPCMADSVRTYLKEQSRIHGCIAGPSRCNEGPEPGRRNVSISTNSFSK